MNIIYKIKKIMIGVVIINIKLAIASTKDKYILENMFQLYLHEISLYFPMNFNSLNGKYIHGGLEKYFDASENQAYFIKEINNIIGFILYVKSDNLNILQEIFILNNFKNQGFGEIAAVKMFNNKKGEWIIKSLPLSPGAERFWKKSISNYTNGNYEIEHTGKYERAVFTFKNK